MSARCRVAVLASGAGSNLDALASAAADPGYPAEIVLAVSNRRDCGALAVAARHGIATTALPVALFDGDARARDRAIVGALREASVDLVVCAGYDRVLSDDVLAAFPGAILNVHPSLLPAFGGGMHAVEDALRAGVKVSGCTVHLLALGAVDCGPIVAQAAVAVLDDDDADTLRRRIHEEEWRLLPHAVALWAERRLRVEGGTVRVLAAADAAASRR